MGHLERGHDRCAICHTDPPNPQTVALATARLLETGYSRGNQAGGRARTTTDPLTMTTEYTWSEFCEEFNFEEDYDKEASCESVRTEYDYEVIADYEGDRYWVIDDID